MKKVALSLLALAVVGTGAFAADVATGTTPVSPLTASISLDASASFGVDLDTKVHGFGANSKTGKLTLWLLNGANTKTGAGDVRGYITADTVKLGWEDNAAVVKVDDITAKILFGENAYLKLFGTSDAKVGYGVEVSEGEAAKAYTGKETYKSYADKYGSDDHDAHYRAGYWNTNSFANLTAYSNVAAKGGVEVGYTIPSVAALTAVVASGDDWTAAQQGAYEASFAVALKAVDKLTLEGKFYTGKSTEALNAAGATVGYDLGLLAPFANANIDLTNSKKNFDFGSTFAPVEGLKATALAQYTEAELINALVTIDVAQDKLAGPVGLNVGFRAFDLTKKVATELGTELFAKVSVKASDVVALSASVNTYNGGYTAVDTYAVIKDSSLFAKVGVDYTGISLTTLSVNWDSSDLGAAKSTGDSKNGKLVFTAKVAY